MIDLRMADDRKPLVAYLLLFFTLFVNVYAKEYVPVLLWESNDVSKKEIHFPALIKWKTEDFTDFIIKEVNSHTEKPLIVVFTEDNLSVEDFSWQDKSEQGSYPKLQQTLTSKSYRVNFVPSVHSPIKAFKDLIQSDYSYKSVDLAHDSAVELPYDSGTVLAIKLDEPKPNEDRPEYLRRHDQSIVDIYNQLLAKNTNILAAYTGHYSSYFDTDSEPVHRVRRLMATPADAPPSGLWRDPGNKIFLHWSGFVPELSDSSKPNSTIALKEPFVVQADERDQGLFQRLIAKFKTNNGNFITLRFRFPSTFDGYWSLSEVECGDADQELILKTDFLIQAPYNFSYHCGENITFVNGTTKLVLSNLQVQPFLQDVIFSDAYDCVWFFTPAIWSGIFVTAILALIMIWGIGMIMDIKTMDRFDDPKGKTITIGSFE